MGHDLRRVTQPGGGGHGHFEQFRRTRAKACLLWAEHAARDRGAHRLARDVDDHRQRPALALGEQAVRHVVRHQRQDFALARNRINGIYVNHRLLVSVSPFSAVN